MATTQNLYTGNGTTTNYSFTFPYLETTDIKVSLDGVDTTAYSFANATTIQFNSAPDAGVAIRIYRQTDDADLSATFYPGSAIRSQDLNDNFTQNLYVTQEIANNAFLTDGSNPMVGDLDMNSYKIINLQSPPTADTDAASKLYVDTKVGVPGPPGYTNWSYTATGGETIVGTSGPVLEYQSGKEQVYLNGVLQQRNVDYTPNDAGSTVTFTVALTAADIVMVRCVNYLAADPTADYSFTRWRKTYNTLPTPNTLIAGNSDDGVGLEYTINREQVFINGVMLQRGVDYQPNNTTSITLLSGPLIVGDVVEVHSNNSI